MTQGFDEWCSSQIIMIKSEARAAYTAGAQSRQAEIDELQKQIYDAWKACEVGCVHKAMKILKGNQND